MNSKSSFSRRTWPLCSKRRKLFSSKRLSSIQKIHTAPFRATFVVNAMRRDLSPPQSSYFQGGLIRALLPSFLMRRPSNSPAKSKAQLCALLSNSRKRSTKTAQRLERRLAAIAVSVLAVIRFFLGKLNSSVKIRRVPRSRHRNFRHAGHVPLYPRSCCPDTKACQKQLPNSLWNQQFRNYPGGWGHRLGPLCPRCVAMDHT